MRATFVLGALHLARFLFGTRLGGLGIGFNVCLLQVIRGALVVLARAFITALAHLLLRARPALRLAGCSRLLLLVFGLLLRLKDAWLLGGHGLAPLKRS